MSLPSLGARRTVIALAVAGAGLALAARRLDWASGGVEAALLAAGGSDVGRVQVDGATAAPGAGALALVVLAAAAAVALAGPAAARLLGGLLALAGVGLVVLAGSVWSDPRAAVAAEGERQAGVSALTVRDVGRGPGPPITLLAGGLVLLAGLGAVRTASGWARTSQRYEREPDADDTTPAEPDDVTDRPAAPSASGARPRSLWEALDRGEDPTRRAGAGPGGRAADPAGDDLPE